MVLVVLTIPVWINFTNKYSRANVTMPGDELKQLNIPQENN